MAVGLAKIADELRARRLAALVAGQAAAWLRQVLPEGRDGSARNSHLLIHGHPFFL